MIDVSIHQDSAGGWWAYVNQRSRLHGPLMRAIGRRFASSLEAAQWGLAKAERMKQENEHDDT